MKFKHHLLFVGFLNLCVSIVAAQTATTLLFPGQTGQTLYNNIIAQYKPDSVLPYNMSRDTLYAKILAKNDSVSCIYTGHTLYLDPNEDPTQYLYLNGSDNGINAEHAYPQSKGASDGNGRSDMHHLFPSRARVNSARVNQPLGESPDNTTLRWYISNQETSQIPQNNKDAYTEDNDIVFEPREAVKGDLARAVFYFFTMYNAEAMAADPNYFELQRETLCLWHLQDPADQQELQKTVKIAAYQDNKPNPFIIDCTLPYRMGYCPNQPVSNCQMLTDIEDPTQPELALTLAPNPCTDQIRLGFDAPFDGSLQVRLVSIAGKELQRFPETAISAGIVEQQLWLSPALLRNAWMGWLELTLKDGRGNLAQATGRIVHIQP